MRYFEIDGTRYYDLRSSNQPIAKPRDTSAVDLAFILVLGAIIGWVIFQGLHIAFIS